MKKLIYVAGFFTVIIFNSCSGVVGDFGKIFKIKDSIEKVYPEANVQINITNGTFINVSLINSDLNQKSDDEKIDAVNKISKIVKFYNKDKNMQGRLNFVKQKNYFIWKQSQSYGFDLNLSRDTLN